ncbi:hypothetical protein [Mesorhizobium sp. INR15]|uniref:hypothetical protein n=1 Tax=Mesorhizobium sp. INR15 TaxID=2654248 RepID=UPI0018967E99|nr:hypothetical protein [Mesorhizobium sp. INR15]QPC93010.1 hypothetical protein GA829_21890 [Mesorhizobium sp. INR15]
MSSSFFRILVAWILVDFVVNEHSEFASILRRRGKYMSEEQKEHAEFASFALAATLAFDDASCSPIGDVERMTRSWDQRVSNAPVSTKPAAGQTDADQT